MHYQLTPEEFWKARALCADVQRAEAEAAHAVTALRAKRQQWDEAIQEQGAYVATLAQAYGFDPAIERFQLVREGLALVTPDAAKGPAPTP